MILLDITQFSRLPARSGVQRALGELAGAWPHDSPALFVAREGSALLGVPPWEFAGVVRDHFRSVGAVSDMPGLLSRLGRRVPRADVDGAVLVLPEPTYDGEVLADFERRQARGQPVAALVYDCFPMTHPEAFAGNGRAAESRYYRLLQTVPLALATSTSVADTLVERLRRSEATTPVVWLGTDHVPGLDRRAPPPLPHLVMVGTVEPRKRYPLALAAVDLLGRHDLQLTVVGRPGVEEPPFLRRLERLAEGESAVTWLRDAGDEDLSNLLSHATALLALGDEGFGLPVAEALRAGCPVAFGGDQPLAALAEGHGAERVDITSSRTLADGLTSWCDPAYAEQRAAEIDTAALPTWDTCATQTAKHLQQLAS